MDCVARLVRAGAANEGFGSGHGRKRRPMGSRRKAGASGTTGKQERWTVMLSLAVLWVGLAAWQWFDHAAARSRHRETFERAGQANLGMLEAAIRSTGQRRRQRPEFLELIFAEVYSIPGIRDAWLLGVDGARLYARSELPNSVS